MSTRKIIERGTHLKSKEINVNSKGINTHTQTFSHDGSRFLSLRPDREERD
jgi:hypothetical protein